MLGSHDFSSGSDVVKFNVTRGDYSPLMKAMADNLEKAKVENIAST